MNPTPPPAPRLRPIPLHFDGKFAVNQFLEAARIMDVTKPATQILPREQLRQPATTYSNELLLIRILDEVNPVDPLDEVLLCVGPCAGVTVADVVDAVRKRVWDAMGLSPDDEDDLDGLPIQSFANPLLKRVWVGLGSPDAEGVCTLKLYGPPGPWRATTASPGA
ncbi:hypothetical protein NMY22_g7376 [Coprinellus aureogranulatus]|nr:hypothetical protein NMY22_g7376 [Coprinellus aureogranulatus]